jgi:hypothetical protein
MLHFSESPFQISGPHSFSHSDGPDTITVKKEPKNVGKPYKDRKRANSRAEKLNQDYGASVYKVRRVEESKKTFAQFMEGWNPPFKKLASGKTPMERARNNPRIDKDKLDQVRTSARRYADHINDPRDPNYKFSADDKGSTLKSNKHPIEVNYTKGDKEGSYIQNTRTTGPVSDRVGAAREKQRMKDMVAQSAKPGTEIYSQPIGSKRAALNQRLGMGGTNDKGIQGGKVAHRSPKQLALKTPPMNPQKHQGIFIDPNH